MLQLTIDGMRVNLPEGMSTEYNVQNPFFTNQGDYTLDIDIPLDDPENARVYHHIHRIDHTRRSSRRTAILSDETGVIVKLLGYNENGELSHFVNTLDLKFEDDAEPFEMPIAIPIAIPEIAPAPTPLVTSDTLFKDDSNALFKDDPEDQLSNTQVLNI